MKIKAVLFDLDGTLLPMDYDEFLKGYMGLLAKKAAGYGYEPKSFVDAVWQGVRGMVKNTGESTNEEVFWRVFSDIVGEKVLQDKPMFDDFYKNEFNGAKAFCGCDAEARTCVDCIKDMGLRTVLATNPIFPAVATESRMRWAGFEPEDFELYTTYENFQYSKPNPNYYKEILKRLELDAEECLMVGNDVKEDMVAETLGMKVFLLTDCLLNSEGTDISVYPHGGFKELLDFVREL